MAFEFTIEGIYIVSDDSTKQDVNFLKNVIQFNQAVYSGGGIWCNNSVALIAPASNNIANNYANVNNNLYCTPTCVDTSGNCACGTEGCNNQSPNSNADNHTVAIVLGVTLPVLAIALVSGFLIKKYFARRSYSRI
jgi:hypothetical protein